MDVAIGMLRLILMIAMGVEHVEASLEDLVC